MTLRQRARNDEDKQARRAAILVQAAQLIEQYSYAKITMAQVARACGLAKGTLYLYFRSKEELFLALVEQELVAWFDDLLDALGQLPSVTADAFGEHFAASVAQRRTLRELLVILHTILEQNVDPDTALTFKAVVRDKLLEGGAALEQVWPAIPAGTGNRTLLRIYALMVGLEQMAFPSDTVASVLSREDMEALRVDFQQDLAAGVADMLRGIERAANRSSARG